MKKRIGVLLLIFLFIASFGEEFRGNYEEGYIEINVNKKIRYSFFPVYMDYELEEPYLGVMNLFALIGAGGLKIDKENKRIYGKIGENSYEFFYGGTSYITGEADVYIRGSDLSKVFEFESYDWDTETYLMKIKTKFKTPYEIRLEQEERLKELGKTKEGIDDEEIYTQKRKLFTPGVIRPRYTNYNVYNIEDGNGKFSANYDTQLLYGDFTTTGFLYPDSYLGYTALTYNEILGNKSIIVGDAYMQTYDFLGSKRLAGIAIQDWNGVGEIEVGQTSIRGFAPFNSSVELYRNGTLYRFTTVGEDGSYVFENINIQNYSDVYTIKIYNFDGTIEIRQVSMMSGSKILKKGKFEYSGIIGTYRKMNETEERIYLEDKSVEGNIRTSYGITNNLTFGLEYTNDFTEKRQGNATVNYPTELIGLNLYYTTGAVKYPTYFEFSEIYDMKYTTVPNQYNHIGKIRQRIGGNVLSLEGYMYGDYISFLEGYQNRYIADWRASINRYWGYNLRYDNIDKFGLIEQYGSTGIYRNKNNTSHELGVSYPLSSDYGTRRVYYNYSNGNIRILKTNLNFVLQINSDYEEFEEGTNVKIGLKTAGNNRFKAGVYAKYDIQEDYEVGLEVKYKVFNWLEGIGSLIYDGEKVSHNVGVDMEKTIILSKPFTKNSNPYTTRSWMEGKVFIDENNNSEYDDGETLLEGVEVKVGRRKVTTNEDGTYFLDNISPYSVREFGVDTESIDPMLEPATEKKYIKLYPSTGAKIDVPIQVISVIMGNITFQGEAVDGVKHFPIVSQLYIQLKTLDGKLLMEERLEPEGFYMLDKVLPGEYLLEMKYKGEGKLTFEEPVKKITIKLDKYGSYYEDYDFKIISFERE